ncbi:multidrug and toxin extrusion protein 1-like isoform X1 [Pristis pectinata]|uniref:multidrug and toxin extrusion protein 1-like isoform X1 n=1 Tax=Pristis pectinata TaxID=685728 RepID=UPI00223D472F|nr:multidrug and toxin extrusion protein 1-like isoform X1 [Pristis pectinata]
MTDVMQVTPNTTPHTSRTRVALLLRGVKRIIPVNFWDEAKRVSLVAGPVFLAQLMEFSISTVSTIFCGHLGRLELEIVSLATTVINVSAISVGAGLASTCDTLFSQTHGSKNLKRLGVILQRGILILMIFCFPCCALLLNTEHILSAFKQSPEVARLTTSYVKIFIPALPAIFLYQLEIKYLQNQGINMPQVFTGFLANIFNAAVNYILVYMLPLGIQGSAAASVVSWYCQAIFLFFYIRWRKLYVETWAGWSTECLQEWGHFVRLAIPSMLMLCIEWWSYEIGMFLSGLINVVELGAQSVVYQILTMIPLGFSVSASVHVGNALGARSPQQAKNLARVALCCTGFCALVTCVILRTVSHVLGYVFTSDKEIILLVADILPLVIIHQLFDAITCVSAGVLRGAGKQKLGAVANFVGFYLIGFPIGISLMFAGKLGILGFWLGLMSCTAIQFVFFQVVIYKLNWNEASDQALVNAGVKKDVNSSHRASGSQTEDILTGVCSGNIAVIDVSPVEDTMGQPREETSAPKTSASPVQETLTVKQLIVRRGLAFLSAPLILAIGLLLLKV